MPVLPVWAFMACSEANFAFFLVPLSQKFENSSLNSLTLNADRRNAKRPRFVQTTNGLACRVAG